LEDGGDEGHEASHQDYELGGAHKSFRHLTEFVLAFQPGKEFLHIFVLFFFHI
jgi:hypothetical protein